MGLTKLLKDLGKVSLGVVTAYLPIACIEEGPLIGQHVYPPQPIRKFDYIPKEPSTFCDAFGFRIERDVDRIAEREGYPVAILKREATKNFPRMRDYKGKLWTILKHGKLSVLAAGSNIPLAEYRYDEERNVIRFQSWADQGRTEILPQGYTPSKGFSFNFRNQWDKLLEFHNDFKRVYGSSLFSEEDILKATAYSEPKKVLTKLEIEAGQLERKISEKLPLDFKKRATPKDKAQAIMLREHSSLRSQIFDLEEITRKYGVLVKTENPRIKYDLDQLRKRLVDLYSKLRKGYGKKENLRLNEIDSFLDITLEELSKISFDTKE